MIGPNSSTQCQNKSKHSISFDNIATLLPSFRSGPLVTCAKICQIDKCFIETCRDLESGFFNVGFFQLLNLLNLGGIAPRILGWRDR